MVRLPQRGRIAVVELFGAIGTAVRPSVYVPLLESVRKNRRIKAVVLDVDSPGGGAPGSAELYASIRRVASEKPVVAYIRGVGASGAYYASCPAQRIVANPDALVGSIGVILLRPILSQLLQRLGVQMSVSKQGRLKDIAAAVAGADGRGAGAGAGADRRHLRRVCGGGGAGAEDG